MPHTVSATWRMWVLREKKDNDPQDEQPGRCVTL